MMFSRFSNLRSRQGMTLMEILLVISLISMVSIAIYNALSNGIKVFQRNQQLVVEEDIVLFMDKLSRDLNRSMMFARIPFQGGEFQFSFPTIIKTKADRRSGLDPEMIIEQLGKVNYYYDVSENTIYRQQANYSQAIQEQFDDGHLLVENVERLKFRYFYYTENEEIYAQEILDVIPSGVEVEIEFFDQKGIRSFKKFIPIRIGS